MEHPHEGRREQSTQQRLQVEATAEPRQPIRQRQVSTAQDFRQALDTRRKLTREELLRQRRAGLGAAGEQLLPATLEQEIPVPAQQLQSQHDGLRLLSTPEPQPQPTAGIPEENRAAAGVQLPGSAPTPLQAARELLAHVPQAGGGWGGTGRRTSRRRGRAERDAAMDSVPHDVVQEGWGWGGTGRRTSRRISSP